MERDLEQKTQQPTPHRLAEARRAGQIPRSRDLVAAATLMAGFGALAWRGPELLDAACAWLRTSLSQLHVESGALSTETAFALMLRAAAWLGWLAAPLCLAGLVMALATSFAQTGLNVRWTAVAPDASRLNPIEGAQKLLRLQSAARGILAAGKIGAVGWFAGREVEALCAAPAWASTASARGAWQMAWSSTWRLGLRLGAVLLALGALDYLLQRWFHVRDLRMSRAELVEEVIRLEGNPSLRRKRRALAMSRRVSAASGR